MLHQPLSGQTSERGAAWINLKAGGHAEDLNADQGWMTEEIARQTAASYHQQALQAEYKAHDLPFKYKSIKYDIISIFLFRHCHPFFFFNLDISHY